MLTIRRRPLVAALLITFALAFVAEQLIAQNATIKGKGKYLSTVNVLMSIPANSQSLSAVDLIPVNMTLVITDVIVSNSTTSPAGFFIAESGVVNKTQTIAVGASSSFAHNFGTSLEFPAGSRIAIFANGQALTATLVGYLRKA